MASTNARTQGGVIGNFTPKATLFDCKDTPVGNTNVGIYVPAGKVVVGCVVKNKADDLVGAGASIAITCGNQDLINATEVGAIKGGCAGGCFEGVYAEADTEIQIEVTGGALTAGTLEVIVIYV